MIITINQLKQGLILTYHDNEEKYLMSLLLIDNKLEPDLQKKTNHFNIFFTSKCTFLINNCNLPGNLPVVQMCSLKQVLLKILKNSYESTCAGVLPTAHSFIKKRLWHRCFSNNFPKFLKTTFFKEHLLDFTFTKSFIGVSKILFWFHLRKIDKLLSDLQKVLAQIV